VSSNLSLCPYWWHHPEFLFSLRHLGHLSHNNIKTRRNSTHYPTFSDIMTELTLIFSVIKKKINPRITSHYLASFDDISPAFALAAK